MLFFSQFPDGTFPCLKVCVDRKARCPLLCSERASLLGFRSNGEIQALRGGAGLHACGKGGWPRLPPCFFYPSQHSGVPILCGEAHLFSCTSEQRMKFSCHGVEQAFRPAATPIEKSALAAEVPIPLRNPLPPARPSLIAASAVPRERQASCYVALHQILGSGWE